MAATIFPDNPEIGDRTFDEKWEWNGIKWTYLPPPQIPGDNGWMPVFAAEIDGERRVLKVIDWLDGTGTKPAINVYVGTTGFVSNIADGVDVRGPAGVDGEQGPQGEQGAPGDASNITWSAITDKPAVIAAGTTATAARATINVPDVDLSVPEIFFVKQITGGAIATAPVVIGSQISGAPTGNLWTPGDLIMSNNQVGGASNGGIYQVNSDGTKTLLVSGVLSASGSNNFDRFIFATFSSSIYSRVRNGVQSRYSLGISTTSLIFHQGEQLDSVLGALASLTTTAKSGFVVAINEINASKAALAGTDNSFTNTNTFKGIRETKVTANTGTAFTIDVTAGTVFDLTLTGNCTYTFPTPAAVNQFTLIQTQDGAGSKTVTWPSSVRWPGGVAPTITSTAGKTDVISFISDGTYWLGFVGGLNFTRS